MMNVYECSVESRAELLRTYQTVYFTSFCLPIQLHNLGQGLKNRNRIHPKMKLVSIIVLLITTLTKLAQSYKPISIVAIPYNDNRSATAAKNPNDSQPQHLRRRRIFEELSRGEDETSPTVLTKAHATIMNIVSGTSRSRQVLASMSADIDDDDVDGMDRTEFSRRRRLRHNPEYSTSMDQAKTGDTAEKSFSSEKRRRDFIKDTTTTEKSMIVQGM